MRAEADGMTALAALARPRGGEPAFLSPHHLLAAQRVRRLFERARLRPKVTMHYGPRTGVAPRPAGADAISDMAADSRKALATLHARLPGECMAVLIDVCGFEKGLQDIEAERGWPRRSAKLVLRIGLEAVARLHGLDPTASGLEGARQRLWLGEDARPREVG